MKIPRAPHAWSVTPRRARQIQQDLSGLVIRHGSVPHPRLVAGCDLAFCPSQTECIAGVVVWDTRAKRVVERRVVRRAVTFPYVPGYLSFREAPAILAAVRKLCCEPDVFIFDGQGYAHPRRFGLACHVGLMIDRPSVGCAKSVLVGDYDVPGAARGSTAPLVSDNERVGMAVRTREGVKPIYVSVGHRLSLGAAVRITLSVCTEYRLPEPTRLADHLVAAEKARIAKRCRVGRRRVMPLKP